MQAEWGIPWDHIYETWTYPQFGAFAEALTERIEAQAKAQSSKARQSDGSMSEQARTQTRWR